MEIPPATEPGIALISMPWPVLNRPSIQLAALKSYVECNTACSVAAFHPYLQIGAALGTEVYAAIADNSWAGESLFAALLFPEQHRLARRNFNECLGSGSRRLPDFKELLGILEESCAAWLQAIPWHTFRLAGFSLCFNQLLASLYLAAELKKLEEAPPVAFGGSSCGGELGRSLLQNFSPIDYVIDGEGETPLAGLCNFLTGKTDRFPARVFSRKHHDEPVQAPEITDLNSLPIPDYAPWFEQMNAVFPGKPFLPVLPVEFSRGCWWNRCTFCNLNLQWHGYRYKSSDTVAKEIRHHTTAHQCLDYVFTDNALPPAESETFFDVTAKSGLDYRFFAEIRGISDGRKLKLLRQGGLATIQVGIEALSSSLLKKMQKGVAAIDNIAMLKQAQAADIRLEGNLIMEFPGSTAAEASETLEHLEYVLPYPPLATATFFLGHCSPVDLRPGEFRITAVTRHHRHRNLFPAEILQNLTLLVKAYRGDRLQQRRRWQPVRARIAVWQEFHRRRSGRCSPPLVYRDGGDFLLIRQETVSGPLLRHRLQGLSRAIYLFCEEIRTAAEISARFASLKESAILAFIDQLCSKRLMFREGDRVLSLAVRER